MSTSLTLISATLVSIASILPVAASRALWSAFVAIVWLAAAIASVFDWIFVVLLSTFAERALRDSWVARVLVAVVISAFFA